MSYAQPLREELKHRLVQRLAPEMLLLFESLREFRGDISDGERFHGFLGLGAFTL